MKMKSTNIDDQLSELGTISAKLHGIGDLIRWHKSEPALNQDEINFGIGEIITDLAEQISVIRNSIEEDRVKSLKRPTRTQSIS